MTTKFDREAAESLLDGASRLPDPPAAEPTVLHVLGVQSREIRISRLLQFFLDPSEVHGLEDLVIRSLLEVAGVQVNGESGEIEAVEREVLTNQANRIDLLVDATEYICCIENKIFAGLANDLEDYRAFTKERATDRSIICIVLTLRELEPREQEIARDADFITVMYDRFLDAVEDQLGPYASEAKPSYLLLLLDFIRSLRNLRGKGMRFDREFVEFLRRSDNITRLNDLLERTESLKKDLRQIVEDVRDRVDEKWKRPDPLPRATCYHAVNPFKFFDSVVYKDIDIGEGAMIDLGVRATLDGWRYRVKAVGNSDLSLVSKAMGELGLESVAHPDEKQRLLIGGLGRPFEFEDNLDDVTDEAVRCLERLLGG